MIMARFLLIITAITIYSCNTSDISISSKSLIPLLENRKWEYKYEKSDSSLIVEITKIVKEPGKITAVFNSFPYFGDFGVSVSEKTDGSFVLNEQDFMFIPPTENINTGYKWESAEWKGTIVNDNENVYVSNKTFKDCIHIRYSLSITFSAEMWVKKGEGIVKWSFIRTNPPSPEFGYFLLNE